MSNDLVRIKPLHYIHVKDVNQDVTRVVVGPLNFACEEYEAVTLKPTKMIIIPPAHYVVIDDPVTSVDGQIVTDDLGRPQLKLGNQEIRTDPEPFYLYPGEKAGKVTPLQVVQPSTALHLKAKRDFHDVHNKVHRKAGESWLFKGPAVYMPQVEVTVVTLIKAIILKPDQALLVKATNDCVDHNNKPRKAGEEWMVREPGPYLPGVYEQLSNVINAHILDDRTGLYVRAKTTFIDERDTKRKAGEEWLITRKDTESFLPGVGEEVFSTVEINVLGPDEFCVVVNPIDPQTGKLHLGTKELRKGPLCFFLFPGESLHESGKQKVRVVRPNECLWMKAKEEFTDDTGNKHKPGDEFYIYGPQKYVTPLEADYMKNTWALVEWPVPVFNVGYLVGAAFIVGFLLYKIFIRS